MFHAAACRVFKTAVFSNDIKQALYGLAHPLSVPSHPSDISSLESQASFETYTLIANTTYQVHTRYTHVCGAWIVFMEHGGEARGIFKSSVFCTYNRSWTFVRFTLFFLLEQA